MEAFRNRVKAPLNERGDDYLLGIRKTHVHELAKLMCVTGAVIFLLLAILAIPLGHFILFVIALAGCLVNLIGLIANVQKLDIAYFSFLICTLGLAFALGWSIIYNLIFDSYNVGFFIYFVLLLIAFGLTMYSWSVLYRDYRFVFENETEQPKYFGLFRQNIIALMR